MKLSDAQIRALRHFSGEDVPRGYNDSAGRFYKTGQWFPSRATVGALVDLQLVTENGKPYPRRYDLTLAGETELKKVIKR